MVGALDMGRAEGGRMPSVMISTPAYSGLAHAAYALSLARTMVAMRGAGIQCEPLLSVGESLIPRERNRHLAEFIGRPDLSHFFMIDSDISWSAMDALRLVASPHEITCGVYRKKTDDVVFSANLDPSNNMVGPYALLRDAPAGFMCIQRSAILKLIYTYPELRCKLNGGAWSDNPHSYALFDTMIDPDSGEYLSEDFGFCRRWQNIGGEVWALTNVALGHHEGKRTYTGRLADMLVDHAT